MSVTVEDVKKALPKYAKLDDNQISEALDLAEGYLNGVNANWETHPKRDAALKLAAISMTLKLHFPQNVDAFNSLDNLVVDMLNAVWSSSNMIKNKSRYCRLVGERNDTSEGAEYRIADGKR